MFVDSRRGREADLPLRLVDRDNHVIRRRVGSRDLDLDGVRGGARDSSRERFVRQVVARAEVVRLAGPAEEERADEAVSRVTRMDVVAQRPWCPRDNDAPRAPGRGDEGGEHRRGGALRRRAVDVAEPRQDDGPIARGGELRERLRDQLGAVVNVARVRGAEPALVLLAERRGIACGGVGDAGLDELEVIGKHRDS